MKHFSICVLQCGRSHCCENAVTKPQLAWVSCEAVVEVEQFNELCAYAVGSFCKTNKWYGFVFAHHSCVTVTHSAQESVMPSSELCEYRKWIKCFDSLIYLVNGDHSLVYLTKIQIVSSLQEQQKQPTVLSTQRKEASLVVPPPPASKADRYQ